MHVHISACIFVCEWACVHVYVCVHVCVCVCAHICVCMCTCVCLFKHTCLCACMQLCTWECGLIWDVEPSSFCVEWRAEEMNSIVVLLSGFLFTLLFDSRIMHLIVLFSVFHMSSLQIFVISYVHPISFKLCCRHHWPLHFIPISVILTSVQLFSFARESLNTGAGVFCKESYCEEVLL